MTTNETDELGRAFSIAGFWVRVLPDAQHGETLAVLDDATRRVTHVFKDQGHARVFLLLRS